MKFNFSGGSVVSFVSSCYYSKYSINSYHMVGVGLFFENFGKHLEDSLSDVAKQHEGVFKTPPSEIQMNEKPKSSLEGNASKIIDNYKSQFYNSPFDK